MGLMDTVQSVLNSVMDLPNKAVNSLGSLGKKAHDEITKGHKYNVTESPKTIQATSDNEYMDPFAIIEKTNGLLNDTPPLDILGDEALDDFLSDMIDTIQEMNGLTTQPPLGDKLITAFEVPVNQTGNLLVEIVEDSTGKSIDFYQEIHNATENAKNAILNATQKVLKPPAQAQLPDYYNLSIIILFVIILVLATGAIFLVYWRKRNNKQTVNYRNNSGIYDVEEATKNVDFKKDPLKFHNVSLA